jgi:5'-nucleotidase / UDP-sugar diphosphatase
MKRLATLFLVLLLAGSAFGQTITILHFNDTHSNLAPVGPRDPSLQGTQGGVARMASCIGSIKAAEDNVLTLHAGDSFIGDLFFNTTYGAGELSLLRAIGVDAMTVGNHEFDLRPSTLYGAVAYAFRNGGFPLLSANLDLSAPAVAPLRSFIFPSMTRTIGGVKIGVFGLTTPATNLLSNPSPAVVSPDVLTIAQNTAAALRADGCRIVLLLSHCGIRIDRQLAYAVPELDAVIGGHDHLALDTPEFITDALGRSTPVVQAGAHYRFLGELRFNVQPGAVSYLDYRLLPVTSAIPEYAPVAGAVNAMIAGIEGIYGPVYSQKISKASALIEEVAHPAAGVGAHDTPAGDLITDAFRQAMGTDIAVCAGGSIAQPLYPGPLVAADVFRMLGYGFNTDNGLGYRMATFSISGAALWAGLEFGLSEAEYDDEFFMQVAGMKYWFDLDKPAMSRLVKVRIGNAPLQPDRMYTVAANEFVPMIMTALGIPVSNVTVYPGLTEFQVVTDYVSQMHTVTPGQKGRIIRVDAGTPKEAAEAAPAEFTLEQNYPNPFNPGTTIAYTMPADGAVQLRVYDAAGAEVATLVNGTVAAGRHLERFDGSRLASGVYHVVLTANGRTAQRAMVLMK